MGLSSSTTHTFDSVWCHELRRSSWHCWSLLSFLSDRCCSYPKKSNPDWRIGSVPWLVWASSRRCLSQPRRLMWFFACFHRDVITEPSYANNTWGMPSMQQQHQQLVCSSHSLTHSPRLTSPMCAAPPPTNPQMCKMFHSEKKNQQKISPTGNSLWRTSTHSTWFVAQVLLM